MTTWMLVKKLGEELGIRLPDSPHSLPLPNWEVEGENFRFRFHGEADANARLYWRVEITWYDGAGASIVVRSTTDDVEILKEAPV